MAIISGRNKCFNNDKQRASIKKSRNRRRVLGARLRLPAGADLFCDPLNAGGSARPPHALARIDAPSPANPKPADRYLAHRYTRRPSRVTNPPTSSRANPTRLFTRAPRKYAAALPNNGRFPPQRAPKVTPVCRFCQRIPRGRPLLPFAGRQCTFILTGKRGRGVEVASEANRLCVLPTSPGAPEAVSRAQFGAHRFRADVSSKQNAWAGLRFAIAIYNARRFRPACYRRLTASILALGVAPNRWKCEEVRPATPQ